jgi:hypothetical protein
MTSSSRSDAEAMARTWWGLYALEVEMSFSLGRPDSLGVDAYHNQRIPLVNASQPPTEVGIISHMLPLTRIIRRVSIEIYHSVSSINKKLELAWQIHSELRQWNTSLPMSLRPDGATPTLREPKWARRQRVVLGIRYLNVQMAMYRPFLAYYTRTQHAPNACTGPLREAVDRCIAAAIETITMMHSVFLQHTFFRTWWWNVTYISFPASVLLLYVSKIQSQTAPQQSQQQPGEGQRKEEIFKSVARAIEVLEAMDECVVAKRAAELLGANLRDLSGGSRGQAAFETSQGEAQRGHDARLLLAMKPEGAAPPAPMMSAYSGEAGQQAQQQHHHQQQDVAAQDGQIKSKTDTPQTLSVEDFNYADLLLEEGWSTLFDDFGMTMPVHM